MRKLLLFSGMLIALTTSMTCQKKACITDVIPPVPDIDTISMYKTDRDDTPPPPSEQWWTLDTSNLDACQQRLWGYLKRMYPNREEDYWDYEIYSIMGEPSEEKLYWAFTEQFLYFFSDTVLFKMLPDPSAGCTSIDSMFFLRAVGQPTCKSYNRVTDETNYFYHFKLRYRQGPCPYIFDQGSKYEHSCHVYHFKYCPALMKMTFRNATGRLVYIDFLLQ